MKSNNKENILKLKREMLKIEAYDAKLLRDNKSKSNTTEKKLPHTTLDWYIEDFAHILILNNKMAIVVVENSEHKYDVYELIRKNKKYEKVYLVEKNFEEIEDALEYIELNDSYLKKTSSFSYKTSSWKKEPATENQLKYVPKICKTKWDATRYLEKNYLKEAVMSINCN